MSHLTLPPTFLAIKEKKCITLSELKKILSSDGVIKNGVYEIPSIYEVSLIKFLSFLYKNDFSTTKKIIVMNQPTNMGDVDFIFLIDNHDNACIKLTLLDRKFKALLLYVESHNA